MKAPGKIILITGGVIIVMICALVAFSLFALKAAIDEANRLRIRPAHKAREDRKKEDKSEEEKINDMLDKINREKQSPDTDPEQQ